VLKKRVLNPSEIRALTKVFGINKVIGYYLIKKGMTNNNYYIKATVGEYILRQFGKIFEHKDVIFETSLLDFLSHKFNGPPLVKTATGERYVNLGDDFICCLEYCEGKERLCEGEIRNSDLLQLGKTLNNYHFAIRKFRPEGERSQNDFERSKNVDFVKARLYPSIEQELNNKSGRNYSSIAAFYNIMKNHLHYLSNELPKLPRDIPVHGDLSLGNVIFLGNKLNALIDFGASHMNEAVYDLANASLYWSIVDSRLNKRRFELLIKGYFMNKKYQVNRLHLLPIMMKWIAWGYCNFWLNEFLFSGVSHRDCYPKLSFFVNKLKAINSGEMLPIIDRLS
jgi:Ser/Thr protein kinase RdoA (MazF antagonist)